MSKTILKVICDNPTHARGKIATIAEFLVELAAGTARPIPARRKRRVERFKSGRAVDGIVKASRAGAESATEFAPHMNRNDWFMWTKGAYPFVCKLCGQEVLPGAQLTAALCNFAARGVTNLKLSELLTSIRNQERP